MRRIACLPILFVYGIGCVAGQSAVPPKAVHAWQDSIQLPTYPENDPDPIPQYPIFGGNLPNYPYPYRGGIVRDHKATQEWRTLNLENEYLFCRILPDFGGHIYNCRDKRNGREVLYNNPVIKKDTVGVRGAWASMGLESNFPAAHARSSSSPVDFALESQPDGSARAIVKDIDRVTGMEWRVEFILRPGSAAMEQHVTFYNRSNVRRPYDWWSTAAIAVDDDELRIIFPTYLVATHDGSLIRPWPEGTSADDGLVAGHTEDIGWFARGSKEPFMAAYKPGSRSGLAHYADPSVVTGKKVWYWSTAENARVKKDLTDNFPSYLEIQAGLFQDQATYYFLGPEEVKSFTEYWMPICDLGGLTRASADALMNLKRAPDGLVTMEVSATHAIPNASIRLSLKGSTVFETHADLTPAETFSKTVDYPGAGALNVELRDASGKILLAHTEGKYEAQSADGVKFGEQPGKDWSRTLENDTFLAERGEYNEVNSRPSLALTDYKQGLSLLPNSVLLEKAVGRLDLELGRADEAEPLFAKAIGGNPSDVEASYLLGVAQAMRGEDAEATKALSRVPAGSPFTDAAALQMTYIAARAKDYPGALAALKPLLIPDVTRAVRAGAFEVALLRRSGKTEAAKKALATWRALDPADTMLRIEAVLLGAEDADLWNRMAKDAERVLNYADEYLSLGMTEDALTLLSHAYPAIPKEQIEPGAVQASQSSLLAYYRAYCRSRLNQDAAEDLRQASAESTRYVFPYRASSYTVLNAALAANPSDATAHFLLGRLLMYRLLEDEAIQEWHKAQSLKPAPAEAAAELSAFTKKMKTESAASVATTEVASLLPARSTPLKSPLEIASAALLRAGAGQATSGASMFDPKVFAAEKQPNEVRRAYIEVRLQGVLEQARKAAPQAVLFALDNLGGEDTSLPFTFNGFFNLMTAPHFEYFSAMIEAACKDTKASRKRWTKISKMNAPIGSPEFVYPLLAAVRVAPEESMARVAAALTQVRAALAKATDANKPALQFNEAMLLYASGQNAEAATKLEMLGHDGPDPWVQYLALVGLREVLDAQK